MKDPKKRPDLDDWQRRQQEKADAERWKRQQEEAERERRRRQEPKEKPG